MYNLLDVFDATRDLYSTLQDKEKRDYERSLRSRGYPSTRRIKFVEEDEFGSDEMIVMDKAAVTRQFEIGVQAMGTEFAVGDGMSIQSRKTAKAVELTHSRPVISHTSLQSEIIALQNVLVMTFLYGPTSSESLSHQLLKISKASRAAGTATVDSMYCVGRK